MAFQIKLPIEVENALLAKAAAEGKDVPTIIVEVMMERFSDELATESSVHSGNASPEDFRQRLRALIASHGVRHENFDDSQSTPVAANESLAGHQCPATAG